MKRTTIFVPEALERDLQLLASRERKPAAAIVREAIAEYLAHRQAAGALPSFAGSFASGRSDIAERHEELLFKELAPHDLTKPPARPVVPGASRGQSKAARRRRRP